MQADKAAANACWEVRSHEAMNRCRWGGAAYAHMNCMSYSYCLTVAHPAPLVLSRALPTLVSNYDDGDIRFVFGVACCAVPGAFPGRETRHQNVTGGSKPTVDWHDRLVLYPPL